MNLFKKIFGKKTTGIEPAVTGNSNVTYQTIQDDANKLWKLLEETLTWYNSISCQCAFPRFRQFTSIDCTDYHGSFYMSETEGFIQNSRPYFDIREVDKGVECYRAVYTCKKCKSTFDAAWSDFSIHVDRMFLKPLDIKAPQIGSDIKTPIPFFVGLFGHKYPDRSLFQKVDFETFSAYIKETKDGH